MCKRFLQIAAVCGFAALLLSSPATAGGDDVDQKIKQLRKELDELREKEKALQKQEQELAKRLAELEREARLKAQERKKKEAAERKKKEEADKKNHYVKIELRGKLVFTPPNLHILTNETKWPLQVSGKHDLQDLAKKYVDKPVIVTGTISTAKPNPWIQPNMPGTPGYPGFPGGWPQQPFPNRWDPWNPYPYGWTETNPTVIIESIRLVEEPRTK